MEETSLLQSQGFQVFKTLGHGAFGRVFLSYNKDIGLIAAKVMQSKVFDENEWDAAGRLQLGEPIPFISLDNIIKKKYTLTPGTLRAIAKQLFEGLRLIHSRGLVHRDIKGENLLMHCPPGSDRVIVKIADFGLVKLQDRLQQSMKMSAKGTPITMAPELLIGDRKSDTKVDVWSVGVVLYQLAYHDYPIKAMTVQQLQQMMQSRRITKPAVIQDVIFWDFIQKLLTFDRKDRYSAEQALLDSYFTGPQAIQQINAEVQQIVQQSLALQQNEDQSITEYDINEAYIISGIEIKTALNYNPDVELQTIYQKIQQGQFQQQQLLYPSQPNSVYTPGSNVSPPPQPYQIQTVQTYNPNNILPGKIYTKIPPNLKPVLIPVGLKPAVIPANIQTVQIQQLDTVQPDQLNNKQNNGIIARPGDDVQFSQENNKVEDSLKSFEEIEDKITEGPEKAELENEVAILSASHARNSN
ncbi:MAG: putative autophagy protein 1 [Streblomastix strix]|uniref:Putative autophagy protein 1 n=1 Tax=Streblomastix strix TaxID=222440 RepID=A0A5J4VN03_9EUKA|nr:MAG: putative autophagy protein 1 [Streblomastix strix]